MIDVILDTNVLIYLKDPNSQYHSWCKKLPSKKFRLFTTSKNLSGYYSVATKGANPFTSVNQAMADIEEFTRTFTILYPNKRSTDWLIKLGHRLKPKGPKIHDLEISAIALSNGIHKIAMLNTIDFLDVAEIDVISPTTLW